MGPYKRLEYDSTGIRYGFSVRVFFILTPKSEHWGQSVETSQKYVFQSLKSANKSWCWPAGGSALALAQGLESPKVQANIAKCSRKHWGEVSKKYLTTMPKLQLISWNIAKPKVWVNIGTKSQKVTLLIPKKFPNWGFWPAGGNDRLQHRAWISRQFELTDPIFMVKSATDWAYKI